MSRPFPSAAREALGDTQLRHNLAHATGVIRDKRARLVEEQGVAAVTMEAVAAAAGVGKGTVFRRFDSREGLMAAVLDFSETAWQASVISGPPPLGPAPRP